MPSKYTQRNFTPPYFYHIFNRGAHQQDIFLDQQDYHTFTQILAHYLRNPQNLPLSIIKRSKKNKGPTLAKPTYSLVAYCLMPNHYHFLLQQIAPPQPQNNISNFIRRTATTYAMYFNNKHEHSGTIFQGKFKNVLIKTDEQLLYITKYIHRNPLKIPWQQSLQDYPYSSYPHYLNKQKRDWINNQEITMYFQQNFKQNYQNFVKEQDDASIITSLTLE